MAVLQPEGVRDSVPVAEAEAHLLALTEPVALSNCLAEGEGEPVCEGDRDALWQPEGVRVMEVQAEGLPEGQSLLDL